MPSAPTIGRRLPLAAPLLFLALFGCTRVGLNLPSDQPDPIPEGRSLRATFGWITTRTGEGAERSPDGSIVIEATRYQGRAAWRQVLEAQAA